MAFGTFILVFNSLTLFRDKSNHSLRNSGVVSDTSDVVERKNVFVEKHGV